MSAILHCIVVGIENDRISNMIKIWRWQKDVDRNKKNVISDLNKFIRVLNRTSKFFVYGYSSSSDLKKVMRAHIRSKLVAQNTINLDDLFYDLW